MRLGEEVNEGAEPTKHAGVAMTTFNVINSIIGSGIIGETIEGEEEEEGGEEKGKRKKKEKEEGERGEKIRRRAEEKEEEEQEEIIDTDNKEISISFNLNVSKMTYVHCTCTFFLLCKIFKSAFFPHIFVAYIQ